MTVPLDDGERQAGSPRRPGRRRWLVGLSLALLAALAIGGWIARPKLAEHMMARAYDRGLAPNPLAALPDGLHVGLCGSGSPMPDPTRAGPCTAIVAGHRLFVVDSGSGSTRNLTLMQLPPGEVEAVFLTHFHSDHIADLGELMLQHWAGGAATRPLPIYGPQGVERVVEGFEAAYQLDRGYRIAHHGPKVVPPSGFGGEARPFVADPRGPDVVLIDEPDLKVTAFPVRHDPAKPAVGYLFVYKGRRVALSGDTAPSPRLQAAAKGADLLVHEGLAANLVGVQRAAALRHGRTNMAAIFHDILAYHTTPEQAAGLAERADVRMLLFSHVIPPMPTSALDQAFLGNSRRIFHGIVQVGRDGDFVTLPAGTREIRRSNRLNSLL